MEELSLAKLSAEKEKTLDMLIRVFEAQIKDLESQVTSGKVLFLPSAGRPSIQWKSISRYPVSNPNSGSRHINLTNRESKKEGEMENYYSSFQP